MSGRKKLFMRMLAWLLLLTLTLGSVDISAISVFAAESVEGEDEVYQPEEEEIYVEADGVRLVDGTEVAMDEAWPEGMSYNNGTLSLNGINISTLNVKNVTIEIADGSENHIEAPEGEQAIHTEGGVRIVGEGTIYAKTSKSTALEIQGNLYITEGAMIYLQAEGTYDDGACGLSGDGSLNVLGGALLDVYGAYMGMILRGDINLSDCTVNTNRLHVHTNMNEEEITPTTTTVGEGANLNIASTETDGEDVRLMILDGCSVVLDGGAINVDIADYDNCIAVMPWEGSFFVKDGNLSIRSASESQAFHVDENGSFTQTGGEINIEATSGFALSKKGSADLQGGDFYIKAESEGMYLSDMLTVRGGNLTVDGGNTGVALNGTGSLNVLSGNINLINNETSIYSAAGLMRVLGGEVTIDATNNAVAFYATKEPITLGTGMYADATLTRNEDDGCYYYSSNQVMISGNGGTYAGFLEVHENRVTAGASFTVKGVYELGKAEGEVSFTLPSQMNLVNGSVTIDGQATEDYTYENQVLTVKMGSAGIVRFCVTPTQEGQYTICSEVDIDGETKTETLDVTVKGVSICLPSMTAQTEVQVSGNAAPNSEIVFYEGETIIGKGTATSLGNWTTTLSLPDEEGIHEIYAIITFADESVDPMETATYLIEYAPDQPVVETLTVRNTVHGKTDADPNQEETLVINYLDNTKSQNFYTYWPELPEFQFEVKFYEGAGTESLEKVWVVTTNRDGEETQVELTWNGTDRTWIGTHEYIEKDGQLPEMFRVEWELVEDYSDDDQVTLPETEITDDGDGIMLKSDQLDFSFQVTDDTDLILSNSREEEVAFQSEKEDDIYNITGNYESGELYIAEFSEGSDASFVGYEDYKRLYILIDDGTTGGKSDYVYQENVIPDVKSENLTDFDGTTFTSDTEYEVGNVLIIDEEQAVYISEKDGDTYYCESPYLSDVYETLSVNMVDMSSGLEEVDIDTEAVVAEFEESELYSVTKSAMQAYAIDEGAEELSDTDFEVGFELKKELGGTETEPKITLEPKLTIQATMKTKVPENTVKKTTLKAEFTYKTVSSIHIKEEIAEGTLKSMFFTEEKENSVTVDISVKKEQETSSQASLDLQGYFGEKVDEFREKYLESLESCEKENKNLKIGQVKVPTPVPGLFVYVKLEFDATMGFFGEVNFQMTQTISGMEGFCYRNMQIEDFSNWTNPVEIKGNIELHVSASAGVGLKVSGGVSLLAFADLGLYAKPGLEASIDGHASINYPIDESNAEALFGVFFTCEVGLNAELAIKRVGNLKLTYDYKFYECKVPLFTLGTNQMPYDYTLFEDDYVEVRSGRNLKNIIDLRLDYQTFELKAGDKEISAIRQRSKVFDLDKYTFELVQIDKGPAVVNVSSDGKITVTKPTEEEIYFRVRVTYTGSTEDYKIQKIVLLKYIPVGFTIIKSISGATEVAGYEVTDLQTGEVRAYSTSESGEVDVPAINGHSYQVVETSCAPKYHPVEGEQYVAANGSVTFVNIKDPEYTPDVEIPVIRDPSGYVYEGMESNRLSDVTVTLYYRDVEEKPETNAEESEIWNAEAFCQVNPVNTDTKGQYLWMVPDGWWQVKYEKEGYETVYSEWLMVPPTQTEVNQAMISYEAGTVETELIRYAESSYLVYRFSKPVQVSTVETTFTYNREALDCYIEPVDAEWCSVGDETVICATTFYCHLFGAEQFVTDQLAELSVKGQTYAGVSMDETKEITIPEVTEKPEDNQTPEIPEVPTDPEGPKEPEGGTNTEDTKDTEETKATVKEVKLSKTVYNYDGKAKKPAVTVYDTDGNVISSDSYTVKYASGRKKVGVYHVTVTMKGDYTGVFTKTFTIRPKGTTIFKIAGGQKSLTVKWKKQKIQTSGYEIQYSTNRKFKKAVTKTVTVKKNKTITKTITRLKKNKKYFVRIRTYKTVKVNRKSYKIFSAWSKVKTQKTK